MEPWISVPEGRTATHANWRRPPHSQWSFRNVRKILATEGIDRHVHDYTHLSTAKRDLGQVTVRNGTATLSVNDVLARSGTDAFLVLKEGVIVAEHYFHGMRREDRHVMFSVSKSVLGLMFGILKDRKLIDPSQLATDHVPELKGSGYEGATIQHILDMAVAVDFREDYQAVDGDVDRYRRATGWDPARPEDADNSTRGMLCQFARAEGRHGEKFLYVSPDTDVAGWIAERATGLSYAELLTEYLWKPMGAEYSAYITVDRFGVARAAGGICATLRDMGRFATLMTGKPVAANVAPAAFLEDTYANGDAEAWAKGASASYIPQGRYRNKWYIKPCPQRVCLAIGIHGQWLYADHDRNIVIVKQSSQDAPVDVAIDQMVMASFEAIADHLA